VECRRCARTIEIQRLDAVKLFGPRAVWKDVGQRLLDDGCQVRTGRLEEDGCWPNWARQGAAVQLNCKFSCKFSPAAEVALRNANDHGNAHADRLHDEITHALAFRLHLAEFVQHKKLRAVL
jgi:hypothetical protein